MQNKGLNTNFSPLLQPEGTYRYALNAVNESTTGDVGFLSKELSVSESASLPEGHIIIGSVYISNDDTLIFSVFNNVSEIGILGKDESYTTLVKTNVLTFSEKYPIRATYRARKNNERTVYFVDALNKPRAINIDKLYKYYTVKYLEWLQLGRALEDFKGEVWDVDKFNLIKTFDTIPNFESVEVLETGSIKSGSYSFGIMYLDEDLNNTNVVTTSNPIVIYHDNLNKEFNQIRGSRNIQSALMSYTHTNKSIKLTLSNFDNSYPFYKVVIIQTNAMTGKANAAFISNIISITEGTYVYDGNDANLNSISLDEIIIEKDDINNVEFIIQLENRLILGKYKTKNVDYTSFQKYASKISSHLTTKKVYLNSIKSYGNAKDPLSSFDNTGYMPGEVYSFGINYVFKDGTISPTYHIPGRNKKDIRESINGFNDNMDYYENTYSKYPEIHSDITRDNYWGRDNHGDFLMGRSKRHHKFPSRKSRNIPLYEKSTTSITLYRYILTATISIKPRSTYPVNVITGEPIGISCNINYKKENSYSNAEFVTSISDNIILENLVIKVYDGDTPLEKINGIYGSVSGEILDHIDNFIVDFSYITTPVETLNPAYCTTNYGIRFDNIELPHPDIVGYFITKNERTDGDKLIIDNALFGPITAYDKGDTKYRVFNKWVNTCNNEFVDGANRNLDDTSLYFYSPEHQYYGKNLHFNHIDIQGYFDTTKITSYNNGEPPTTGDYDIRDYSIVIPDIMEGTSYNPDVHSDPDSDGFNLLVGYRNSNLTYHSLKEGDIKWSYTSSGESTIDNILYIGGANSKYYDSKTFYNACQDNKIGIIKFKDENPLFVGNYDKSILFGTTNSKLYYGSLIVNNESAYTNFMDRDYYKEHNNIIRFKADNFGETVDIYNGDCYINSSTLVASTYYGMKMANRDKKSKKSSGILGVALIVVGVAATIFTAGAALGIFGAVGLATIAGVSAVGAMALSAGASMYSANLNLEALKKMISEDYPKGLEQAIADPDMSNQPTTEYPYGCGLADGTSETDDCITWFSDRVTDLFLESSINTGLRTSLTGTGIDFINSLSTGGSSTSKLSNGTTVNMLGFDEEEFRAYLTEKLTIISEGGSSSSTNDSTSLSSSTTDSTTSQGTTSGRVYRGFATTEWYDVNPDYHKKNTEKVFIHLPITYETSVIGNDYSQKYNNRLIYSQQSFQEEQTDNHRTFLVNNYKDIEAEFGAITGLFKMSNSLFIHTSEGLWQVPRATQEKLTGELSTYIGTGEFLSLPPIKINQGVDEGRSKVKVDSGISNYGSQHDYSTVGTSVGTFFVNQRNNQVYLLSSGGVNELSELGMDRWFKENLELKIGNQLYELDQYKWKVNNPMVGSGIFAAYDPQFDRIILTKRDYEFTNTVDFVGTFDNTKLDYTTGDIFVGDKNNSNGLYEDNIFYLVDQPRYLSKRNLKFSNFIIDSNVLISDVDLIPTETFSNITGHWYNKNEYTYETIDYGNTECITTITQDINWTNININKPNGLRDEYINAYFEFDFTPEETKVYTFYNNTNGISTLFINNIAVVNNQQALVADTVYSMRLDYYHSIGTASLVCGIAATTVNNGSLQKTTLGTVVYVPPTNFEGEDSFYVTTNKSVNKNRVEQINISVKDRVGDEYSFPYWSLINQTGVPTVVYYTDSITESSEISNFSNKYRKVLVFPCIQDGVIELSNSITVPHTIQIVYNDTQTFTVDNIELWNKDLKDIYSFNIKHDDANYFTVIIDIKWENPINNPDYIKSIFYSIDYKI